MDPPGVELPPPRPAFVVRLPGEWYVACLSSQLRDRPLARTVLDVPLALFRDAAGASVAVLDRCPHRNAPLSIGTVRRGLLECRYHGWRFDGEGRCRMVPGLVEQPQQPPPPGGGRDTARDVRRFETAEHDGFVWVRLVPAPVGGGGEPFRFPAADDPAYTTVRRANQVDATLYSALENTLDVPHTAVLHRGLFRGGGGRSPIDVVVRRTADRVEAEYIGEHRPGGAAGRLLAPGGGEVRHFDRFVLPSIAQVEYQLGTNHLFVTTAFTPVSDFRTALHTAVTFSLRLPAWLVRAAVTPVANRIFAQDAAMLRHQAANIRRFGGEHFASTPVDVLGGHIVRMLERAGRGGPPDTGSEERRVRMRV